LGSGWQEKALYVDPARRIVAPFIAEQLGLRLAEAMFALADMRNYAA